jgi:hypothetical protein
MSFASKSLMLSAGSPDELIMYAWVVAELVPVRREPVSWLRFQMPTSGLVRRLPSLTSFLGSLHPQQSSLTSPAWLFLRRRNSLSKLLPPKEVSV